MNNIRCLTAVTYYYLHVSKLRDLSINYPVLREAINQEQKTQKYNKLLDLEPLDYTEVYFKVEEKYDLPLYIMKSLKQDNLSKIPRLRLMLKNAVMHYLIQQRKKLKMSSLSAALKKNLHE